MNHQPYRGWLLSEEELGREQSKALEAHLSTCDECSRLKSSWDELEAVIDRAALLEPAAGFVERWQIRLVEHQQHQQKLKGWYTIGATSMLAISLVILLVMQAWSIIQAPNAYLAAWLDQLVGIISILFTIRIFASSFSIPSPLVTLAGLVIVFGVISFTSVLWLATYRKISMVRRQI